MSRISRRVAAVTESATLAIDARAKALRAAGENVIGFGAGEPDFPTPEPIVEAAIAAARDPRFHHYSPTPGLPELREAIAFKTKRDSGVDCSAAHVVVTNGGKHAVYNTFQVLCNEGDEVLVPAPYWTSYPEVMDRCGILNGVAKTYAMTGWRVGWMIGPSDVTAAATNLQSHSTSNVSNVAQAATFAALSGDLVAVAQMR